MRQEDWKPACLAALALFAAIWIAFAPALNHAFLNHDDPEYLTENPNVLAGLTPTGAVWAFTHTHSANWHPVTWLSHMLDVELYGTEPRGHHATNILIHAATTVILFGWLLGLTRALLPSLLVAVLFGLHPLRVESVAWISERKDVLAAFFWVLTCWLYTRYTIRPSRIRYIFMLLTFSLGLMSKAMLVTLPCALVLLDYWPHTRWNFASWRKTLPAAIREKWPLFALSILASVITVFAQQKSGALQSLSTYTVDIRIANALQSYFNYLVMTIWPVNLSPLYMHRGPSLFSLKTFISLIAIAGISAAVWRVAARDRHLFSGWLWFLGTLVPVLGLVQVGAQAMADRFTYIPSIGIAFATAWSLARWKPRSLGVITPLLALALGSLTFVQTQYWRDGVTLFSRAVEIEPENAQAHTFLGAALYGDARYEDAADHFERAVELAPDYSRLRYRWGMTALKLERYDVAERELEYYLHLQPDDPAAQYELATLFAKRGAFERSLPYFEAIVRNNPNAVPALNNLGNALFALGRVEDARGRYQEVLAIDPANAIAHGNLTLLDTRH